MSPLIKRVPRELKNNLGKYIAIFLLMCLSIALTSGFLLAAHSISVIIDDMDTVYKIEDGRFTTSFEATSAQLDAARKAAKDAGHKAMIYPNYSIDAAFTKAHGDDGTKRTLRVRAMTTKVDLSAYAQGRKPRAAGEVAVDRVFAANNSIEVGDTVKLHGVPLKVVGIMTQADSQTLFLNNSDFTVNTVTYGVGELTADGMRALEDAGAAPAYTYSFTFAGSPSVAKRTDIEKDMVKALNKADARVDDLTDASANQGIGYAADDVEGDSVMWTVLLEIIIAIMAFVFVVLTTATIEEESAVIGTLLASGYRRRELVAHYLLTPAIVGVTAAVVGCVLGVAVFTNPMQGLYYDSYSLPPFHITWSWGIFVKTTVVPVAVLVGITLLGLLRKMNLTPLQFLRHETSGKAGTKRGLALPERYGFVARFRLRVFLRNLGNFATLFFGIAFASMLLLFGLAVLPTMTHYADNLHNTLVAQHQYTLKAPLELDGTQAEREAWAAADALQSVDGTKLSAVEDAADALERAASDAKAKAATAQASRSASDARAAQDATATVATAQDAFYAKVDAVAGDLGMSRDDALDLIENVDGLDLDDEGAHPVNTVDNGAKKIAQAEKYAVYQLEYDRGEGNGTESVTVYGVPEDSRYWKGLSVGDGHVVLGAGLVDKFGFAAGDRIKLYDKYEDKTYKVTMEGADGTWGTKSDMNIYMSLSDFNSFFGNDADYFNAYASDKALDLDARYFASDLTPDDMDAIGDQFVGMMSDMIGLMVALSVSIFLIFMYLLTKAVIDHSARAISYMKVFGYRDREISKLYIRSITLVVAVSLVLCLPVIIGVLTAVFRGMLLSYNGNIEIYVPNKALVECVATGFVSYLVVAMLHTRAIKRVPLAEALKVQE